MFTSKASLFLFILPFISSSAYKSTATEDNDTSSLTSSSLFLGGSHSCMVDNLDKLKCWGSNGMGEVGDGTGGTYLDQVKVPTIISLHRHKTTFPKKVALGIDFSCAIDNLDNLKCWGCNTSGQLGIGNLYFNSWKTRPTAVSLSRWVFDSTYATQISGGYQHTCAVDNINNLKCWGDNTYGQLGDGTLRHRNRPKLISLSSGEDGSYPTQISLGGFHTCAIDNLNNLKCWGNNQFGQIGIGMNNEVEKTPTIVSLGSEDDDSTYPIYVGTGAYFTCAIDNQKTLKCWGSNLNGQLGKRAHWSYNESTPTTVKLDNDNESEERTYPIQISLGANHVCIIDNLNRLRCWGSNSSGEIGNGAEENVETPTTITLSDGSSSTTFPTHIAAGDSYTCALDNTDTLWCWGNNNMGQLGDGTNDGSMKPKKIITSLARVQPLGDHHDNLNIVIKEE